jgi:hypothetical protein
MTRFGIYKRVRQHADRIEPASLPPSSRRITPHVFRHYLPFLTMSCPLTPGPFAWRVAESVPT